LTAWCVAPRKATWWSALRKQWPRLASEHTLAQNHPPLSFTFRENYKTPKAAPWIRLNQVTTFWYESLANGMSWTINTSPLLGSGSLFEKLFGQLCFLIFHFF
jgi:hypothetical protein